MAIFPFDEFVTHVVTHYDVQADSVLALYIKIATYLRDNPIVSENTVADIVNKYLEDNPIEGDFYSPRNPPPYPVSSVNGKTGDVTGLYDNNNPPPYPVTSVNGKTGVVTGLYSADNPPPYPVTSVDGKTGDVESYSMLGVRKVFGKDGALMFVENDGKIGGISGGVPHYCYSDLVPPPQGDPGTTILTKVFTGLTADTEFNFLKTDESLGFSVDRVIACIAYNTNKTTVLTDVNIDLSIPSYGITCFRRGQGNDDFINSGITNVKVYYI